MNKSIHKASREDLMSGGFYQLSSQLLPILGPEETVFISYLYSMITVTPYAMKWYESHQRLQKSLGMSVGALKRVTASLKKNELITMELYSKGYYYGLNYEKLTKLVSDSGRSNESRLDENCLSGSSNELGKGKGLELPIKNKNRETSSTLEAPATTLATVDVALSNQLIVETQQAGPEETKHLDMDNNNLNLDDLLEHEKLSNPSIQPQDFNPGKVDQAQDLNFESVLMEESRQDTLDNNQSSCQVTRQSSKGNLLIKGERLEETMVLNPDSYPLPVNLNGNTCYEITVEWSSIVDNKIDQEINETQECVLISLLPNGVTRKRMSSALYNLRTGSGSLAVKYLQERKVIRKLKIQLEDSSWISF